MDNLYKAYLGVYEAKDNSYLETDMEKRKKNNEKAIEDMKKTDAHKDMVATIRKKFDEEFESVVEYLFVEGYANTIEGAEEMAENISENWVNEIMEARASERKGLGSPESPLSYPGRKIQKERGEKGGRHQYSGSVEYGGAARERGRKKRDPQSQAQRLRGLSTYPEKPGKYAEMQRKKRGGDIGSRFD
jgi:hypothetical protein